MRRIPAHGRPAADVLAELEKFKDGDLPWRTARTWAYVYDPGEEAESLLKEAFGTFLTENALDPTVFPSTMRLERELVAMAAAHLGGDDEVVGSFTSGGTESIMCAVKAARDFARAVRPDMGRPEIVLPVTAHAAFHKAAHYLGLETVTTAVDPVTFKADVDAIADAITPNTVLVVASAVSYAHGVVDPVAAIGELAAERDLWLHVDGCMGGFLLPYFRRLGRTVPDFDFSVPGVRSISMDFHKYAFAAKGASVVLYRQKRYRAHQMYACAGWTGYTVINPTVQSTKSGGPLAAAWAILQHIGDDGYLQLASTMASMTDRLVDGVGSIPDLRVLGSPEMNLLAFTSDTVNIFHVIDEMKVRGWYVQPQLGFDVSPANAHLSINPASERWVEDLLVDLADAVEAARALPSGELGPAVAAALAGADSFGDDAYAALLDTAQLDPTSLPERMAPVNEILDALPQAFKERLLVAYLNDLYVDRG